MNEKTIQVYEYIVERISHDISPTVREICDDLNIKSTSTAYRYINQLCDEGLITKSTSANRSIQLTKSNSVSRIPILGAVAAGSPITAIEEIEGYIPFDGNITSGETFALRIEGDSMQDCGIFNGDIVIVERTPVAMNGEIVVALIDDSATVKTFYKENSHFRLQPENKNYEPIIVDEVTILGKVIASVRYYR